MRAGDGPLAAWHDGIERLFRERGPVFGRLCRFDRRSGTGIPLAGMTAFPGLCDRTLYGQADAGQVGSKVVQVKYRLRTAGKIPQIPEVRGFFADAGQKRTALVCGYENKK